MIKASTAHFGKLGLGGAKAYLCTSDVNFLQGVMKALVVLRKELFVHSFLQR